MKNRLQLLVTGSLIMALNAVSFAATVPYGMGGCGLGALVIKKNGMGTQLGTALINNLVFPATFAMSTGTSNCTEDLSKISSIEKEVYITANYGSIIKEAAQGTGEHLSTLASMFGCSTDAQADFGRLSQERYDSLFVDSEANAILERYQSEVRSSSKLAETCSTKS